MIPKLRSVFSSFLSLARWQQLLIGLGLAVFLMMLASAGGDESVPPAQASSQVRVAVSDMSAQPHRRAIVVYGASAPARDVPLHAQASGQVLERVAKEGSLLKKGDVILTIDPRDRPERLAQAKALLAQRGIEYEAARKLQKRGFESQVRLAQAKTALKEARASVKQIELEAGFLQLSAPFDGLLESINVEEGDFVGIGTFGVEGAAARMVDMNPLLIKAQLAENDRSAVQVGDVARVRLADGSEHEAVVSLLAGVAGEQSRTFAIEAEVANADFSLSAGVTARLIVYGAPQMAYRVSASVLGLDDDGRVGIKRLDAQRKVHFEPVRILEETTDGLWIAGPPDQMRLIRTGHAYVSDGQLLEESMIELPKQGKQEASETTEAKTDAQSD